MSRIANVKFELKSYDFREPFKITGWTHTKAKNIEITVELENGFIGIGEASPNYRVNGEMVSALLGIEKDVNELLRGMDVRGYRRVFEVIDGFSRTAPSVKAALQFAVLDAFSMESGVPVYQILGGAKRAIKTDKTVGIDTLENMVEKAKKYRAEGFEVLKVKVGQNVKEDVKKMFAISQAVKDAAFIVDANQGYSPKEAIRFADALYRNGVNVVVFEQPVMWYNHDGLKLIRQNTVFPVAADESAKSKYDVYNLIKEECVDFVNIKLMKSGLSDALAIVELAKIVGINLMIGCMSESSVGINQSIHFATGTGAFLYHDLDSHLLLKEEKFRGKFTQKGPEIAV